MFDSVPVAAVSDVPPGQVSEVAEEGAQMAPRHDPRVAEKQGRSRPTGTA